MALRPHRRNLVVWRQSAGPAESHALRRPWRAGRPSPAGRLSRARRIRRRMRIVFLLTVVTLWPAARAVRARWRPLLAGAVLTGANVVLRGNELAGIVLLPGIVLLLSAPLFPGAPEADRPRRAELERELAGYSTNAQRYDLEATLDRYPDDVTREVRDILAGQPASAHYQRSPGTGRYWCRGF
jgi:hypothetical protein